MAIPMLPPMSSSPAFDRDRRPEVGQDPVGDPEGRGLIGLGQQDAELVPAQSGDQVGLPDGAEEPGVELLEDLVAAVVAEGVVDLLEAIQVEYQEREAGVRPPGRRDGVSDMPDQQGAVGEAGQLVVRRLVGQLRLGHLAVGDVACDGRGPDDPPRRVADRRDRQRDVEDASVLGASARLDLIDLLPGVDQFEDAAYLALQAGRHEERDRAADGLIGRVSVEPLGAGVPTGDDAAAVPADDGIGGRLHDRRQSPEGLLGADPLGVLLGQAPVGLPQLGGPLPDRPLDPFLRDLELGPACGGGAHLAAPRGCRPG